MWIVCNSLKLLQAIINYFFCDKFTRIIRLKGLIWLEFLFIKDFFDYKCMIILMNEHGVEVYKIQIL